MLVTAPIQVSSQMISPGVMCWRKLVKIHTRGPMAGGGQMVMSEPLMGSHLRLVWVCRYRLRMRVAIFPPSRDIPLPLSILLFALFSKNSTTGWRKGSVNQMLTLQVLKCEFNLSNSLGEAEKGGYLELAGQSVSS